MGKKLYVAPYVFTQVDTSLGLTISAVSKESRVAGCMWAFETMTAARKFYGRNVQLKTIEVADKDDEA